jgi:NTE family protein
MNSKLLHPKLAGRKPHFGKNRPPFEAIALVLQGGGALGSYQAGVYEAMAEIDLHPDWVAGISIGAINAAIIAGNPPEERVSQLKGFWESITAHPVLDLFTLHEILTPQGDLARGLFNQMSAGFALLGGAAGFFEPRHPAALLQPSATPEAASFYDSGKLKATLERFVDFDRINFGEMRFSVGAVNVRTGNFNYFDNKRDDIRAEHVMASGSLPPGFSAVEIDGEFYWDGGLVSNTPLQWVVDGETRQDTLAFQIDLWSARGNLPRNLHDVATRQKDIQYSSRTRAGTDQFRYAQRIRGALANLIPNLPPELRDSEDVELLKSVADHKVFNIVHLIYRAREYEGHSKDYEFSRLTMNEHWQSGYRDAELTLRHPQIFKRPENRDGVSTFDLANEGPAVWTNGTGFEPDGMVTPDAN